MPANATRSKRFQSWPASLLLFSIATVGEFGALAGWYLSDAAGWRLAAPLALLTGFLIERWMVVLWLDLPQRVITPSGNLSRLVLVLAGVTVAEIAAWIIWIRLAQAQAPWLGAAVLVVGIHLVHSYEVALLKHSDVQSELKEGGVILLTGLEAVGGIVALRLATRGLLGCAGAAMFVALLIEHLLQVSALKRAKEEDEEDTGAVLSRAVAS
jgi:hypothetical protein